MEKRLELEKRGRAPSQIKDLNLDNCRSANIVGLTDEFCNLESLSMINVGLCNLKGFPKLPNLKKLELSDNRISSGLNLLHGCPNLVHLNLCANLIKDTDALKPLKEFKHLETLDLFNCEVISLEGYREKVFNWIPSLKYLDGFDRDNREMPSEDDEDEEDEEEEDAAGDDDEEDAEQEDGVEEDEEDDEEDEEDDEDADDDGPGLNYLENSDIDEDDEDEFVADEEDDAADEDDDDLSDEEQLVATPAKVDAAAAAAVLTDDVAARGQKRKHVEEEEDDEEDANDDDDDE